MRMILYEVGIQLFLGLIRVHAVFNSKTRRLIRIRRQTFPEIMTSKSKRLWVHVASLGEYEQVLPLLKSFKETFPDWDITLTFFSSSGFDHITDHELVDRITCIPFDTKRNASKFLSYLNPDLVIFVKYDFWLNHLKACLDLSIPVIYVSCVFNNKQSYFTYLSRWYLPIFSRISHFFVQNEQSFETLKSKGINQVTISGDTRVDQVISRAYNLEHFDKLDAFFDGSPVMILGSVWPDDIEVFSSALIKLADTYQLIIVPHEVDEPHLQQIIKTVGEIDLLRWSEIGFKSNKRHLLVDSVGQLASLYQYSRLVYIGGGVHGALHNLLEPAAHGKPILFASNTRNQKFIESAGLQKAGGAFAVKDADEFLSLVYLLEKPETYNQASAAALAYLQSHSGATETIMGYLKRQYA